MLYVTTRSQRDAYTDHWVLTHDLAPDGGQFLPRAMPSFDEAALEDVASRSFNQNVAYVLSLLYRKQITGWDVDLTIGKRPMDIMELNSRTLVAEVWRNSEWRFDQFVERLYRLFVEEPEAKPSQWFVMSVRIAVLFGVYGTLMSRGTVSVEQPLDIAVPSFDFQFPMAAWYARSWGLPIGGIICCCNENNAPWTLLHQGELRTDLEPKETFTSACDQAVPGGLERLIFGVLGGDETRRYINAVASRCRYKLEPAMRDLLRRGLSVSVVSQRRMAFMLPNIYRTGRWIPDPYSAMSYAGLVDHRSRPGDTGMALVISEEDPVFSVEMLSRFIGISEDKLRSRLEKA